MRELDLSKKYPSFVDEKGDLHTWCNHCCGYVIERNREVKK